MPIKIFFCYAHEDELLLKKLKKHLSSLQRQGLVDFWYDCDISAGSEWESEIGKRLNEAQVILLLISPDFIDSNYCYGIEMQRALERHERGEAHVIPIILRPTYWQGTPFGKLQVLPKTAKPVSSFRNRNDAFYLITIEINNIIKKLNPNYLTEQGIIVATETKSMPASSLQEKTYSRDELREALVRGEPIFNLTFVCTDQFPEHDKEYQETWYTEIRTPNGDLFTLIVCLPGYDVLEFPPYSISAYDSVIICWIDHSIINLDPLFMLTDLKSFAMKNNVLSIEGCMVTIEKGKPREQYVFVHISLLTGELSIFFLS